MGNMASRPTLMHEIGHQFGLPHSWDNHPVNGDMYMNHLVIKGYWTGNIMSYASKRFVEAELFKGTVHLPLTKSQADLVNSNLSEWR